MSKSQRRRAAVLALAVSALPAVAAAATDSWGISLGIRETGSAGAIGTDGGTAGAIEWVTSINPTLQTITPTGVWTQYTWNFGSDTVTAFPGSGNGVIDGTKGVLEELRIVNSGGNSGGEITMRLDDIVNTTTGGPTTITGFEGYTVDPNDKSGKWMFREPIFSSTTLANIGPGYDHNYLESTAHGGSKALANRWAFVPNGNTTQWLRLTTSGATNVPNPVIDISPTSSVSMWINTTVYNPTPGRARGIDVSQNQSTIDWTKLATPAASGGGGREFAFIRATRGGTSGTSSTGAMRVDDTTFSANITSGKTTNMVIGPYHFARYDMWTPGDTNGLTDSPSSVGTPEDEARHFMEVAGKYMKPGYMRPTFDLEQAESLTVTQLTNFILRFADHIKKYKGPAAGIIIYSNSSDAASIDSRAAQYPLWMASWPNPPADYSAGHPSTSESFYGAWDPPGTGNPMPWSFWQYYSPDLYIPGSPATAATHNDIDVANGDINWVKQNYMVQGAIWDGSGGNNWTTASSWDTNAVPTSSTEVLFDTGTTTITVASGQNASGIYFATGRTLSGGSITLSDGRIDVDSLTTATLQTNLFTTGGFRKVGLGTLIHASGTSTFAGIIDVLQGTMTASGGSIAATGNLLVDPELTQFDKSLVAPLPTSASQISSSTMTVSGAIVSAAAGFVGGSSTASGGIGTLTVSSGSLTLSGALKIWNSTLPFVDSKVNLSGGTLSVGSLDTNGDIASFNWTAGTFAVTGAGGLAIQSGGPLGTTLTVASGKTLNVTNVLAVGTSSSVNLQSTGSISVGSIDVGGDQTRFSWTGGTFTHNGPGSSDLGTRTIGGGVVQTLNVNGGSLSNATLTVGALSAGTVNHSAGTHAISTALNIGQGSGVGVIGTHNVSGTAFVNVTGALYLGGNSSGTSGGTGIMNISGGTVSVSGTAKIWNAGAAAPGGTRLNLTGGQLNVHTIDLNGNAARLNIAGGAFGHFGPGTSDLSGLTVNSGSLTISGGTVSGTLLTTAAGSTLSVGSAGTLSAVTINNGTMSLSNGTISGAVTNNGTMNILGGTITGSVDNVGTMNINGATPATYGVAATVDSDGIVNVNSPASVAFNAGIAGNGTMNVAAGASATSPVVSFQTLNIHGTWTLAPDWPAAGAVAGTLNVTGTLNLANNDAIVLTTPLGSWNGTAYTGVTGMIATNKITSSASGLTRLAAAEAGAVNKTTFAGWPVDPTNVLIMFSYGGDANLSGAIDADDYFQIDSSLNDPPASLNYNKGDFDLNGVIDGDDYAIIDASYIGQGPPFTPGAVAEGVRVVPEPSTVALFAFGLSALRRQRRSAAR